MAAKPLSSADIGSVVDRINIIIDPSFGRIMGLEEKDFVPHKGLISELKYFMGDDTRFLENSGEYHLVLVPEERGILFSFIGFDPERRIGKVIIETGRIFGEYGRENLFEEITLKLEEEIRLREGGSLSPFKTVVSHILGNPSPTRKDYLYFGVLPISDNFGKLENYMPTDSILRF